MFNCFDPSVDLSLIAVVGMTAFLSEYLDSALGMGYGTALTPILVLLGFDPFKVIPAVLVSQLTTDIATCFCHHKFANVNLRPESPDFKVAMTLGSFSVLGVVLAVCVAVAIPKWLLSWYMGWIVLLMGVVIILTINKSFRLSWGKVLGVSVLASFNKGISGGGYGPLLMGGQLLSGVHPRSAVAITALAEACTCLAGFLTFLFVGKPLDSGLIILLICCALPAVPLAAYSVNKIHPQRIRLFIGVLIIILGFVAVIRLAPA